MAGHRLPFDREQFAPALHLIIRFGVLLVLFWWCFTIIQPFLNPLLWGMILAIASHPLFLRLKRAVGGRAAVAAGLYALGCLVLLVLPAALLGSTLLSSLKYVAQHLSDGTFRVPAPPAAVREWVLVGDQVHRFWLLASTNLDQALTTIAPELGKVGRWLFTMAGDVLVGFLQFVLAIFIAAALMMNAATGQRLAGDVATRLAGAAGQGYAVLTVHTIRSVTRGIVGVALIQSLLAGLGFLVAGIPAAGLLALLCLIISVVQLPLIVVLLPASIYAFTDLPPVWAGIFTAWCAGITLLDNVLKPLLLGRGVDVPMLIVFIGAIGGLLTSGILGLFVGPVVLALGYTLLLTWLQTAAEGAEPPTEG